MRRVIAAIPIMLLVASVFPVVTASASSDPSLPIGRSQPSARSTEIRSSAESAGDFGEWKSAPRTFVPNEVIVRYASDIAPAGRSFTRELVGAEVVHSIGARVELLRLSDREGVKDTVKVLEQRDQVVYAEPNFYLHAMAQPNDPYFARLWGLHNSGQSVDGLVGTADADIDAVEAWDRTTGSSSVKVAVVDTGVAYDHPDLAPNMVGGWDFVDNDADPSDPDGHGTHVAGTIAAKGNNGAGVSGVAWSASIIPVRVLGEDVGTTADVVAGINYAVQQGARVVNLSLGGSSYSQAMVDAIAGSSNTLFVVAAGNDGDSNDIEASYPCNYSAANIICVAATNQADSLAAFSNYSSTKVDIAAPGVNIFSSQPAFSTAFWDDFEGTSKWTSGGTSRWGFEEDFLGFYASDSPYADYANNADNWIDTAAKIDLQGKTGCAINYWMYLDTEFDYDGMVVGASTDDTNWTVVDGWTGWSEEWLPFTADLSSFDGTQVRLSFGMVSDAEVTYDGVSIDDVSVDCEKGTYTGSEFDYLAGTSMATPHVTGAAALLWSLKPAASVAEVKGALLEGVDSKPSLSGKVLSGGRLNVLYALNSLVPPGPIAHGYADSND